MDIGELVHIYHKEVKDYIISVSKDGSAAAPMIVSRIVTVVVPGMMKIVGHVPGLSGAEKKQLVVDAIIALLNVIFDELDEQLFSEQEWDEQLHAVLKFTVPPLIDVLISTENGRLKFNGGPFWRSVLCC